MRRDSLLLSFFKITIITVALNGCLPSSNFKKSDGAVVSPGDDLSNGGNGGNTAGGGNTNSGGGNTTTNNNPPSQQTLESVDAMSDDETLSKDNNKIVNADLPGITTIIMNHLGLDLSDTGYSPTIAKEEIYVSLVVKFNHVELKNAVISELEDMEILANSPTCTLTCTLKLEAGHKADNYRDTIDSLSNVGVITSKYELLDSASTRITSEAAIKIKERDDRNAASTAAKQAEAAKITLDSSALLSNQVYRYYNSDSKIYRYNMSPYNGGPKDKQTRAFNAYKASKKPTDAIPINLHVNDTGRYIYRTSTSLGGKWVNKGPAFYAFNGPKDFQQSFGVRVKTIPIYELYKTVPVNSKNTTTYLYVPYPDYLTAISETLVTLTGDGWKINGPVFWIPVNY